MLFKEKNMTFEVVCHAKYYWEFSRDFVIDVIKLPWNSLDFNNQISFQSLLMTILAKSSKEQLFISFIIYIQIQVIMESFTKMELLFIVQKGG